MRTIKKIIDVDGKDKVMKREVSMGPMGPQEQDVTAEEMLRRRKKDHEISILSLQSIEELIQEEENEKTV